MAIKSGAKSIKSGRRAKDLRAKSVTAGKAKAVRGGIEITDYGFGVSMPVTTSRSDGGTAKK